jgi:hypothetical protein
MAHGMLNDGLYEFSPQRREGAKKGKGKLNRQIFASFAPLRGIIYMVPLLLLFSKV